MFAADLDSTALSVAGRCERSSTTCTFGGGCTALSAVHCAQARGSAETSLQVFLDSSMPVVQHYEQLGKVRRFKSDRDPEVIYQEVRKLF